MKRVKARERKLKGRKGGCYIVICKMKWCEKSVLNVNTKRGLELKGLTR